MFASRIEAGRCLAARLEPPPEGGVVLGLPSGGVPVAEEVGRVLGLPVDVVLVRKLRTPGEPELAMGAIGEQGARVLNLGVIRRAGVSDARLAGIEACEREELDHRARVLRARHERIPLAGRVAIVVDDGIATGATVRAACQVVRAENPRRIILATPVAPRGFRCLLADAADELVCARTPSTFFGVGQEYEDFSPVSEDEVLACLDRARRLVPPPEEGPAGLPCRDAQVRLPVDAGELQGHLTVPADAGGVVVFVHGSGSSRHSPRNRYVARRLNDAGLATLLFDLLTQAEEDARENVFDIDLLTDRLAAVTGWLAFEPRVAALPVGYFAASTGAAAAMRAGADPANAVAAIVCRGGRTDLAGPGTARLRVPTLLIVGALDPVVLRLNERTQADLRCENRLEIVPGARHLFEEPGALDRVAGAARDWFTQHLGHPLPRASGHA